MKRLSDDELLDELKTRIEDRRKAHLEMAQLNEQLLEVNQKLTESEKLRSNFLSNARNEVINPLSSILTLSQSITELNYQDFEEAKRLASIIYKEAFDLDFQMNNIFSSAEIEAGEASCEYYDIELYSFVQNQINRFKSLAYDHGMSLILEKTPENENLLTKSDPAKIGSILDNLIVNAINWSDKKGEIKIRISHSNEHWMISVSDPGPGIDEKDQKIIFDRFKTLNPAVHTENKGHGLGLSLVKAYVELMDGEVTIKSRKGKGSTFTVSFPNLSPDTQSQGTSSNGNDFLFGDSELF
ncbi:MAG: HAMP domain-containing histidine kinase [Bacteroidales bacterium]|nr:HAMP domain-containing histidine kinase [Bacteroidales bacterium]